MKKLKKLLIIISVIAFLISISSISNAASSGGFDMTKMMNTMKYSIFIILGIGVVIVTVFIVLFRKNIIDIYSTPRDMLIKGIASVYLVNPNYINDPKVVKNLEKAGINPDEVIQYALLHEDELTNQSSSIPKEDTSVEAEEESEEVLEETEEVAEEKPKDFEDMVIAKFDKIMDERKAKKEQMEKNKFQNTDVIDEATMDDVLTPLDNNPTKKDDKK